ncbi:hypothetical protein GF361_00160 [Candidatus Woesearchaeota archaeon]|nr:hypothetical protein [Candidatus Woesearchaeota archaeon]
MKANDELQEKLIEVGKLGEAAGKEQKRFEARKKKSKKNKLKDKEAAVKEKMKKGGKLTTEDLLLMQELDN